MKKSLFISLVILVFMGVGLTVTQVAAAVNFTPQGEVALLKEYGSGTAVRLLAFARGTDNKLYGNRQVANNAWAYPFWKQIAGSSKITGNIAAEAKPNGSNWVFSKNSNDNLVYTKQCQPGGTWSNWAAIGGKAMTINSQIAVMRNADNSIQIFARRTSNNRLYTLKQNADGTWPISWTVLGNNIQISDKIAVGRLSPNSTKALQVFVKDNSTGNLLTLWQQKASGNWTANYTDLGGQLAPDDYGVHSNIAVANNLDGRLEVLSIDQQRQKLRHIYQRTGSIYWSAWEDLPTDGSYDYGPLDQVALGRNTDGRLEAFVLTSYLIMVHIAQLPNTVSIWGPIEQMPSIWLNTEPSSPIAASSTGTGNITVFCMPFLDDNGNPIQKLYQSYKDDSNVWTPFLEASNEVIGDLDGNVYRTVTLGTQTWTVENWKCTKYNDGTPIKRANNAGEWNVDDIPKFAWYNFDEANKDTYGAYYKFFAVVDPLNPNPHAPLAPKGWHLPSIWEWQTLRDWLIANGYNDDGSTDRNRIAKSVASKEYWEPSDFPESPGNNPSSNNRSGFSGFPFGYLDHVAAFSMFGKTTFWWSSTYGGGGEDAAVCRLDYQWWALFCDFDGGFGTYFYGFPVRFVKD